MTATKTYLVDVKLNIGEYEKSSRHLVDAENENKALEFALLGECHNNLGEGSEWTDDDKDQIEDDFGGMIYSAYSVKEISEEDAETLKKYW